MSGPLPVGYVSVILPAMYIGFSSDIRPFLRMNERAFKAMSFSKVSE